MKYLKYHEDPYLVDVGILIKESALKLSEITRHYVKPLVSRGVVKEEQCMAYSLAYNGSKKLPAAQCHEYLAELMPILKAQGIKILLVNDANYFKMLIKDTSKIASKQGYVLDCKYKGGEGIKVVLGHSYGAFYANEAAEVNSINSIKTVSDFMEGSYIAPGDIDDKLDIRVHDDPKNIKNLLDDLLNKPKLYCDIEAFSLKHYNAGVGTISFSEDDVSADTFKVEAEKHYWAEIIPDPKKPDKPKVTDYFTKHSPNTEYAKTVKRLLKEFFNAYQGKLYFHKGAYDAKCLIYTLYMEHLNDHKGMLEGLHNVCRNMHDTHTVAYLATNTTVLNPLGLKHLAHRYLGKYEEDVGDIRKVPLEKLLTYNAKDTIGTAWIHNEYQPIMEKDNQQDVYDKIMQPSLKVIVQMELTGMCLDMGKVLEAEKALQKVVNETTEAVLKSQIVKDTVYSLRLKQVDKDNLKLKTKVRTIDEVDIEFKLNSPTKLQTLLYDTLGLPVIDKTKKGAPSTGADTIEKLIHHTKEPDAIEVLKHLIKYGKADKILSSFIPAFKAAPKGIDGKHYLFGCFNLGGTKSGRLSSSDVNLQQLPSTGSPYAKMIKKCFIAPDGMVYGGADFASLEDRINTLLTKDTNKLKVYTDGFDGHCLRAAYYFRDKLPDIDLSSVQSVNAIEEIAPELRQDSKAPTFALTYLGNWLTLVRNEGFPEELAKKVEENFHTLYAESGVWLNNKLHQAANDGYAELAFGLRLRCPVLAKTLLGTSFTPKQAEAEWRTMGNAIGGQSYGLMNTRAANEFMQRVWDGPYAEHIRIAAQIHDAIYLYIAQIPEVIEWVNINLIECMSWNELPEIQHDIVKLEADLELFYPNWARAIKIPLRASTQEIINICKAA